VLYCKVLLGLVKCNLKMANVKDALVALTQARDLLVNTIVSESPLHLELRLSYARLRVFGGEYKKANKMYRDCLDMAVGRYGKSHATVAYLLHKIGLVEYLQGNLAVAAAYVEEALYMRLKIFKDDHPDVAATEQLKGLMITDLGRYDEAAVLCERAMVTQRIALGPRHPAVARSLLGLGQAFCKKGLPLEAVEYCSHALDINREVFGRLEGRNPGGTVTADMHAAEGENAVMPHPVVSSNLAVLGSTYVAQGLYMQGQLLLEQALGEMEMVLASLAEVEGEGPDNEEERYPATHHLARAHVQRELARAYMLGYEGSDATKLITAAGATFATICGEGSFFVADCVAIAADISHHEGRYRDAQVQYSRASVIHTTEQGPQHPVGKFEIALRACRNTSVVGYLTGTLDTVAALLKEFPQSSLPQNGKVMADLFMVQAHVLFDQEKFQNASNVATQAMEIYKEAVGIDSVLHVSAVLLICDCSIKLGDLNDVKVRLGMCITKARAAVEHPDNSNTGSLLNYKDKHPILGEIASSLATLANPKFKPGQVNLPALQIMEAQVSPLYNNRCGAEHSAAQWAAGRLGIYMNLDKRKTGDELLNGALASFESAGEATEEAGGQLFFTADSRWVASLGGYATQRLKVLKSTHEKHINVQPYCAWALVPLSTTPGDDGSVGTMGTGNVSRASGVIIDGVGKGPKYPECPAADAVQLTPGGASPWGFLSYGAGKADGSGSAKREAVKPSKRGRGDDKRSEPGNGILALAVFNGEAPVSMAVSNMFGAADAEHVAAIQKAEARARAAAVEEAEQLARELLERNDRDDMSIASNSLMSGDGNFAAMSEEERIVLESLRVERACEEEEVERLKKERDDAEEAMLAIKAQREEEEEATNKAREELAKFQAEMELFRQKHEAEMTRVKHEMTAAQSVAQAQAVPDDTVALHAVDAVVEASAEPVVADEAAEAPPSGGSAGEAPSSSPHESSPAPVQPEEAEAAEEASIAAETAADQNGGGVGVAASEETGGAAVAVAITDPFPEPKEEIAKKSESVAEATAPA
jgi:tetratricopeptide (TPR) repeat protein